MVPASSAADDHRSKSQIKRELAALQELGVRLLDLSDQDLDRMPVAESLRAAVRAARRLKREARRRQLQYIGVLMRREDEAPLRLALDELQGRLRQEQQAFHDAERWRDELLAGDTAVMETLCRRCPELDRQHLRQLVRNAGREQEQGKPPKSARLLFRYLYQQFTARTPAQPATPE